jgi:5'(3')-deoxyribonucleotidase
MSKYIIYIDMDDTLCKFTEAYNYVKEHLPTCEYPQSRSHFFEDLEPFKGAVGFINKLRKMELYDVYILTAPSYMNPLCYTEKRLWIEKHFDLDFCKNLIICDNKGLCKGDVLIDDHITGRGQENFEGELIQFGTKFTDWQTTFRYVVQTYR